MLLATHVFFRLRAFFTIVRLAGTRATTDDAAALVRAEVALVANPHNGCWADVRVAYDALAVALFTKLSDGCRDFERLSP